MTPFRKHDKIGHKEVLPGIAQKTLVYGERTLMTEFILRQGSLLPDHAHPYEQTGYLVEGRLRVKIGGQAFEAAPGDSWCIPMNITHGADVLEDAVAIEVFSPRRDDYIPA